MLSSRLRRQHPSPDRGFTLVELMVVIALVALLLRLGLPAFNTMLRNAQVRTTADALQNGLRTAQGEALRRNRQVVFSLTDDAPDATNFTVRENGRNWQIHTVVRTGNNDTFEAGEDDQTRQFVQGGALGEAVDLTGPAAVCFNSTGRLVANTKPGVGDAVTCAVSATPFRYVVSVSGSDRPLQVELAANGRVRMCDPAKTYSSTVPDGCLNPVTP